MASRVTIVVASASALVAVVGGVVAVTVAAVDGADLGKTSLVLGAKEIIHQIKEDNAYSKRTQSISSRWAYSTLDSHE